MLPEPIEKAIINIKPNVYSKNNFTFRIDFFMHHLVTFPFVTIKKESFENSVFKEEMKKTLKEFDEILEIISYNIKLNEEENKKILLCFTAMKTLVDLIENNIKFNFFLQLDKDTKVIKNEGKNEYYYKYNLFLSTINDLIVFLEKFFFKFEEEFEKNNSFFFKKYNLHDYDKFIPENNLYFIIKNIYLPLTEQYREKKFHLVFKDKIRKNKQKRIYIIKENYVENTIEFEDEKEIFPLLMKITEPDAFFVFEKDVQIEKENILYYNKIYMNNKDIWKKIEEFYCKKGILAKIIFES